jgi:serine/threonine-protein kinase
MGTVWVARDRVLAVELAVKLVSLPGHDTVALARRVLGEARTAARLGHPAIVRINDFGITKLGDPYLAMELLDGEDLADLLGREGRVNPISALSMILPIAHALATAHENGIVHRDVKPENIFLANIEQGLQPKLLDFGIARFTDRTQRLTFAGAVMGTPDYLSPQVAKGEIANWSADQWALCVVLYELVTGRCPFQGHNYYELVRSIINDEPPALGEYGAHEPQLEAVIMRGLEKDVDRRWGSMRELGQQLAQWCLQRGITEDVTGQSIRRTWLRDGDSSLFDAGSIPGTVRVAEVVPLNNGAKSSGTAGVARGSLVDRQPSEPDLQAIAALHQVGDPVDLFARASLRRSIGVGVALVGCVVLGLVVFLVGAGFLGPWGP